MKISVVSLGLLALLTPLAGAWSKEDREIFRVRDELLAHEGPNVTFYEFLGVSKSASQDDISKAYKKKSRQLHPDKVKSQLTAERVRLQKEKAKEEKKNKGGKSTIVVTKPPTASELKAAIKRAGERQTRLHLVTEVLRGAGRDRYDFFLANGFPTWKGTEYYYSRYRPGLGTVMFGVFLFVGGGVHYLALYMSWKKQREFVERYIKFARRAAWGEGNLGVNVPGLEAEPVPVPAAAPQQQMMQDEEGRAIPMNRKMKRMQEREEKKESRKEEKGSGRRAGRRGGGKEKESGGSGSVTPLPPAPEGSGPTGAKKRIVAENGKVLVVDSLGDVYLEQEDEDGNTAEYLLDLNELPAPTYKDTAVIRLPIWAYNRTLGRFISKPEDEYAQVSQDDDEEEVVGAAIDDNSSEPGKDTPSTGSAEDYELLEKSVDELGQAKTTSSQKQSGGQAGKRKNKKR